MNTETKYVERLSMFDKDGKQSVKTVEHSIVVDNKIPKLGLMLVGWGGNNGSTITAGILANKNNLEWETKSGM